MIAELGPWSFAFVAAACLLSGFGHGALGFGFPIVATPLVALVIDIKSAIALLAPITLVLTLITALGGGPLSAIFRSHWVVLLAAALGSWLGTRLLIAAPPEPFVLVLALAILLYLNLDRLGHGRSALVQRLQAPFGFGFGFVAGVSEAIANVAGPILLIYFMLLGLAPAQIIQTLNVCFSMGKGTQTATWAMSGTMTTMNWAAIGVLTVPSVAALFFGMRVRGRIDAPTYRRWLRGALWVMAVLLLAQVSAQALAAPGEEIFRAIEQDRESAAVALAVRGGVHVNARNGARETPLHRAVEKDMKALAQALVRSGADLRATARNGETALHLATLHPDPWFADLLLAAGADPRARTSDGESVLMWAVLTGHTAIVRRLLARGADASVSDRKGNLPLHAAAEGGHLELVRLLLPLTAKPGARNREGLSAADYARLRSHPEIEDLLKGAD